MNKAVKAEFMRRLAARDLAPRTELCYATPFQLLIAVLLSAQATDVSVNKATATLYQVAPDARAMLALGVAGVKHHIRNIGLFNTKAENVIKTCRLLLDTYAGEVPRERDALEALPGVGRKTAATLLKHFGTLEGVYENLDAVAELKFRGASFVGQSLREHRELAFLSRRLTGIACDMPLAVAHEDLRRRPPDLAAADAFYDAHGFGRMLREQARRVAHVASAG